MDRRGLGDGRYVKPRTFQECRKLLTSKMTELDSERRVIHSRSLVLQGVWTKWMDSVSPFDFSWKKIIYQINPKLFSFVLNAMINSLPTPDMRRL